MDENRDRQADRYLQTGISHSVDWALKYQYSNTMCDLTASLLRQDDRSECVHHKCVASACSISASIRCVNDPLSPSKMWHLKAPCLLQVCTTLRKCRDQQAKLWSRKVCSFWGRWSPASFSRFPTTCRTAHMAICVALSSDECSCDLIV